MRRDTLISEIRNIKSSLVDEGEPPLLIVLHSEEKGVYVGMSAGFVYEGQLADLTTREGIALAGGRPIGVIARVAREAFSAPMFLCQ